MKVVIIAAGMGSRLRNKTDKTPKTLLPVGEGTILSTILHNFNKIGIDGFVIVTGYQAEHIKEYLRNQNNFGFNISTVENREWEKGNGISVLMTQPEFENENFILSMSDHIVTPGALKTIVDYQSDKNLLLVDSRIDEVFDIDDATKVLCEGSRIKHIGKEIPNYNAIDCGIFKLNHRFFNSMNNALEKGSDSISAGINILIGNNDMDAVFLEKTESWIDIDTPQAYEYFLKDHKFK